MREGWEYKKLGEICNIGIGKTPSRADDSLWDKEKEQGNAWVSIADISSAVNGIILETKEYISNAAKPTMKLIPKGTILLSFKLTIGKTAIAGKDLYTNEAIANLPIVIDGLVKEFLLYYFQYFDWDSFASGEEKVKGKTLNKKKLNVLPVYYPSLDEQLRIVSFLDSEFSKIDTLKANAERIIQECQNLKQSLLKQVFEKP